MRGRHQSSSDRPRLRWLAALAGGAVFGAVLFGFTAGATGAAPNPVSATFGVTGVATDGCPVSVGGTDVYVKPGQDLKVNSSLAGLYLRGVLGQKIDLNGIVGKIAFPGGALKIDPGTSHERMLDISTTTQTVSGLAAGPHRWTWTVDRVTALGLLNVPLYINAGAVGAGAKLSWSGTIHVTSKQTKCGVAIQVPSISASASAPGLPPIKLGLPGAKLSVPVSVPNLGSSGGSGGGGGSHGKPTPKSHGSTPAQLGNVVPVPAQVVPRGDTNEVFGDSAFHPDNLDLGAGGNGTSRLPGTASGAPAKQAASQQQLRSTGKHKTIDLASNKPSTGQLSIVLAIVAVVALALVAGTYARLYLLRKDS